MGTAMRLKHREQAIVGNFALRHARMSALKAKEAAETAKMEAKKASEKLSWGKSLAKERPTAANQAQIVVLSQQAQRAALVEKKASAKALSAANTAVKKAESRKHAEQNAID